MNRIKVGKGYYQNGHGRDLISAPLVYEIDGKTYAKHLQGWKLCYEPLQGELQGYVPVTGLTAPFGGKTRYFQTN